MQYPTDDDPLHVVSCGRFSLGRRSALQIEGVRAFLFRNGREGMLRAMRDPRMLHSGGVPTADRIDPFDVRVKDLFWAFYMRYRESGDMEYMGNSSSAQERDTIVARAFEEVSAMSDEEFMSWLRSTPPERP